MHTKISTEATKADAQTVLNKFIKYYTGGMFESWEAYIGDVVEGKTSDNVKEYRKAIQAMRARLSLYLDADNAEQLMLGNMISWQDVLANVRRTFNLEEDKISFSGWMKEVGEIAGDKGRGMEQKMRKMKAFLSQYMFSSRATADKPYPLCLDFPTDRTRQHYPEEWSPVVASLSMYILTMESRAMSPKAWERVEATLISKIGGEYSYRKMHENRQLLYKAIDNQVEFPTKTLNAMVKGAMEEQQESGSEDELEGLQALKKHFGAKWNNGAQKKNKKHVGYFGNGKGNSNPKGGEQRRSDNCGECMKIYGEWIIHPGGRPNWKKEHDIYVKSRRNEWQNNRTEGMAALEKAKQQQPAEESSNEEESEDEEERYGARTNFGLLRPVRRKKETVPSNGGKRGAVETKGPRKQKKGIRKAPRNGTGAAKATNGENPAFNIVGVGKTPAKEKKGGSSSKNLLYEPMYRATVNKNKYPENYSSWNVNVLVDSGACRSLMHEKLLKGKQYTLAGKRSRRYTSASGEGIKLWNRLVDVEMDVKGIGVLKLKNVAVHKGKFSSEMLLGRVDMRRLNVDVIYSANKPYVMFGEKMRKMGAYGKEKYKIDPEERKKVQTMNHEKEAKQQTKTTEEQEQRMVKHMMKIIKEEISKVVNNANERIEKMITQAEKEADKGGGEKKLNKIKCTAESNEVKIWCNDKWCDTIEIEGTKYPINEEGTTLRGPLGFKCPFTGGFVSTF